MDCVVSLIFGKRPPKPPPRLSKKSKGKAPETPAESRYARLLKTFQDRFLLLTPTPQELSALRAQRLDEDPIWRVRQNEWKNRPPLLDLVRIAFYDDITKLYRDIEPDIETFVRLPESGGLDLRKLRREWGLETCAPIHPSKWKVEYTADPDWMSPIAVYNNTDHRVRCIKFTEPSVSPLTVYQRRLRASILVLVRPVMRFPSLCAESVHQELVNMMWMFIILFTLTAWIYGLFTLPGVLNTPTMWLNYAHISPVPF